MSQTKFQDILHDFFFFSGSTVFHDFWVLTTDKDFFLLLLNVGKRRMTALQIFHRHLLFTLLNTPVQFLAFKFVLRREKLSRKVQKKFPFRSPTQILRLIFKRHVFCFYLLQVSMTKL